MTAKTPGPSKQRSIYGFVWLLTVAVVALTYAVVLLVPRSLLEAAGMDYLPTRYWIVCIPLVIGGLVPFIPLSLALLNLSFNNELDSVNNFQDEHSRFAPEGWEGDDGIWPLFDRKPMEVSEEIVKEFLGRREVVGR